MTHGELLDLAERVGPVLVFLVAITVVAEIADVAGVFDVAGHWAARLGRHRTPLLWLLLVLLVVPRDDRPQPRHHRGAADPGGHRRRPPARAHAVPFVMTTLWLANTAQLLLPVSNLTNLLCAAPLRRCWRRARGLRAARRRGRPWRSIAATVLVLAVLHRADLRGRYEPDAPPEPHDRVLLIVAGAVCVALGPAFVSGSPPPSRHPSRRWCWSVALGVRTGGRCAGSPCRG